MRAFAGGYYENLRAMYDYLEVSYHAQRFLFCFSRMCAKRGRESERLHFIHSSNSHQLPPLRPPDMSRWAYLIETAYLLILYSYFTICCFFISTRPASSGGACESLEDYVRRIFLPRYFTEHYLLPLMSSVATCSHSDILTSPARDLIEYKRKTTGAKHYVVSNGVREVQKKLAKGLDIKTERRVVEIKSVNGKVLLLWRDSFNESNIGEEMFDRVVLTGPPNIIGAIFEPLRELTACIPTRTVTSVVQRSGVSISASQNMRFGSLRGEAEVIHFRTLQGQNACTESIHIRPSGARVVTCPLQYFDPTTLIQETSFTRVLRSSESRRIVNDIFRPLVRHENDMEEKRRPWRNGDGGVWLAGGWCWDGMVLLEGCIFSAMRIADDFGVAVPWRDVA